MLSYVNTFINLAVSIVLMLTLFSHKRYLARIFGSVIALAVVTVYALWSLWKKESPKFNSEYWKFGLKLSLPIIPHGLGQVILLSVDRIMIARIIGYVESGIYSFAYTIYSLIRVTSDSLLTVFEPWAYSKISEANFREVQKKATYLFYGICGISTAVILFSPELIFILGSKKYEDSVYCVIPVLLGGIFAMAYTIPSVATYYYQKTKSIALGTAITSVLNICLNYILIPKFGYIAAAYTTLICYIIYFLYHYVLSLKSAGFKMIQIRHVLAGFAVPIAVSFITFITLERFEIRIFTFLLIFGIVYLFVKKREA